MDRLPTYPRVYKHPWFTIDFVQVDGVFIYSRTGQPDATALPYEVKFVMTSGAIVTYNVTEDHAKDIRSNYESFLAFSETVH